MFTEKLKKRIIPRNLYVLWISFLLNGTISGLLSFGVYYLLRTYGHQSYDDFVIGSITWVNYNKSADYLFIIFFFVCFVILNLFTIPFFNKYVKKEMKLSVPEVNSNLILLFVAGLVTYIFTMWFITGKLPATEIFILAIISSLCFFTYSFYANKTEKLNKVLRNISSYLLFIVFVYFSYQSAIIFLRFLNPTFLTDNIFMTKKLAKLVLLLALLIAFVLNKRFKHNVDYSWRLLLGFSQLLLPMQFLIMGNFTYQQNLTFYRPELPFLTKFILVSVSFIGVLIILFNILKIKKTAIDTKFSNLIYVPSILSISCFLAYRNPAYSPFAHDDFHLGELMLPWQQIVEFKQQMYTDFVSVQGLLGLIYGGINQFLFNGNGATFPLALVTLPVLVSILMSYILSRFLGNGWALLLCLVTFPVADRNSLVLPILLILLMPSLLKKPTQWMMAWGWLSLLHCFYNSSSGGALTAATLPILVYMLVQAYKQKEYQKLIKQKPIQLILVAVVHIVLIAFLIPSMVGLVQFVRENGAANTVAYGIGLTQVGQNIPAWFPHWFSNQLLEYLSWEILRTGGWIASAIILLYFLLKTQVINSHLNDDEKLKSKQIAFLSLTGFLYVLILVPYSMGRIDPGSLSRTGSSSLLAVGYFLPMVVILDMANKRFKLVSAALLGVFLAYRVAFIFIDFEKLPLRTVETIAVPQEAILFEDNKNYPNIGKTFILNERLNEILQLKTALNGILKPDETYFDFTNKSAMYYYFNLKEPSPYSADFVAANYEMQTKVIRKIKENPPPAVLLGPNSIRHDGGPASLRSYRTYKYFVASKNYTYLEKDGFQFLIRNDRYSDLGFPEKEGLQNTLEISRIFTQKELMAIPLAWGKSESKLNQRFDNDSITLSDEALKNAVVNDLQREEDGFYKVSGVDPFFEWKLPEEAKGSEFDFLVLHVEPRGSKQDFRGQLFWKQDGHDEYSEDRSFQFDLREGTIILPLGSHPAWLTAEGITHIRFDIDGYNDTLLITKVELRKLIK